MGWSEVVHENRKRAELQRAREELRLLRRGFPVEEQPSAGVPAVLALAGVLTAAAWWRKEGRRAKGSRDWRSLPGVSQLLDFLQSGSQPKPKAPTRSKSKPKAQLAPPSKAAAARQAAAGGRPAAAAAGGGGGTARAGSSAVAAAGAAALQRAGGGSGGGGGSNAAAQPQAAANAQQTSSNKAKKKKSKKKK